MGCINIKNHGKRKGVAKPWQRDAASSYKRHKKTYCENKDCGFVAIHPSQLDVDHIDGNRSNNALDNLQTLCAGRHRLKTAINREFCGGKWKHLRLKKDVV